MDILPRLFHLREYGTNLEQSRLTNTALIPLVPVDMAHNQSGCLTEKAPAHFVSTDHRYYLQAGQECQVT